MRNGVLVGGQEESFESLAERAKLYLMCSGVDLEEATWVAIAHDGTRGDGQGQHVHVSWVSDEAKTHGGHASAAMAARIWARIHGRPEAAQAVSVGVGAVAGRDWERSPEDTEALVQSYITQAHKLVIFNDRESAGGLWLHKTANRVNELENEYSGYRVRRYGAVPHLWGCD